jgi:hypothetical protein
VTKPKPWTIGDRVEFNVTSKRVERGRIVRFGTHGLPYVTRPMSDVALIETINGEILVPLKSLRRSQGQRGPYKKRERGA